MMQINIYYTHVQGLACGIELDIVSRRYPMFADGPLMGIIRLNRVAFSGC
jgi:hypothetical protein